ncbi:MAG: SMC-Scp complex subunit ScpB [Dehalococcoidia bacterium]
MTAQNLHEKISPPAPERLPAVLESLLFVAEEPLEIGTLAKSLNVPRQRIEHAIEAMSESVNGRGLFIQRHGDRVQLATAPDAAPYIERFLEVDHGRLSRASLETLAIIVYRQPVTRTMIDSVRGVNSDHAVATLLARELIEEVGRAPGPGRPVLLGTSVRFLEYFGLGRPDDLPPLPELEAAPEELAQAEAEDGDEATADDEEPATVEAGPPPDDDESSTEE